MSIRSRSAIVAVLALLVCSIALPSSAQRAIIRYDPQAPLQALPDRDRDRAEDELDDLFGIQDQGDPTRRLRLISDFISNYPTSEFTHLIYQARWQTRLEQEDPEAIIDTALEALDAYQYFMDSKLGFIEEPEGLPQYPTAQFRLASQKMRYYQSIAEAYVNLGQPERLPEYTELGLDSADEADLWYDQLGDDADDVVGMDSEAYAELGTNVRMFLLNNLRNQHQQDENISGMIDVGERMLEILPDDIQLLMSTSLLMTQEVPEDPAAREDRMERARDYSDRALEGIDVFLLRSDLPEEQQNAARAQIYSTLGMASAQLAEWQTAISAYQAAIQATPGSANFYYMLGISATNANDIDIALPAFARAHFLAPEIAEIRSSLEDIYQVKEGSLDGIDAYVESEGASIGN